MKIAITGITGFLGSKITAFLKEKGQENLSIIGFGRANHASVNIKFALGEPISSKQWDGIDILIHCAYDFSLRDPKTIWEKNVEGSKSLIGSAKESGVKKIIFLSSMAAYLDCKSYYGKAKLEIETEAAKQGVIIVRPGLVFGEQAGGVFGILRKIVKSFPVIPLIGGGKQKIYLCHEEELGAFIYSFCMDDKVDGTEGPIILAQEGGATFKGVLTVLAKEEHKHIKFVSIPFGLASLGVKCIEKIGIFHNLRSDSLISLIYADPAPDFTNTKKYSLKYGIYFRSFG